jgi:tetratricopeptide (TPR) repeat protein
MERDEGNLHAAQRLYTEGVNLLGRLAPEANDAQWQLELATGKNRLALVLAKRGNWNQADKYFQEAEAVFMDFATARDGVVSYRITYAQSLVNYGSLNQNSGRLSRAESCFETAIELGNSVRAIDPANTQARLVIALANNNLGAQLFRQGEADRAIACFAVAIAEARGVARDFPSVPNYRLRLAGILMGAGVVHAQTGRVDDGMEFAEEAVASLESLVGRFPEKIEYRHALGGALSNLAMLLTDYSTNYQRAESVCRRAIEIQGAALRDTPSDAQVRLFLLTHYWQLASTQIAIGKLKEAGTTCDDAIRLGETWLELNPSQDLVAEVLQRLKATKADLENGAIVNGSSLENDR